MVKNVLGAAAGAGKGLRGSTGSPLEDAGAALGIDIDTSATEASSKPKPTASSAVPVASMSQENSYLKGLDFGEPVPQPQARPVQENSYLKGFDLDADAQQASSQKDMTLASVSVNTSPAPPAAKPRNA